MNTFGFNFEAYVDMYNGIIKDLKDDDCGTNYEELHKELEYNFIELENMYDALFDGTWDGPLDYKDREQLIGYINVKTKLLQEKYDEYVWLKYWD